MFNECNINGSGWAEVDTLVNTIQQMIPSSPKKGEDVYDSDESVSWWNCTTGMCVSTCIGLVVDVNLTVKIITGTLVLCTYHTRNYDI